MAERLSMDTIKQAINDVQGAVMRGTQDRGWRSFLGGAIAGTLAISGLLGVAAGIGAIAGVTLATTNAIIAGGLVGGLVTGTVTTLAARSNIFAFQQGRQVGQVESAIAHEIGEQG